MTCLIFLFSFTTCYFPNEIFQEHIHNILIQYQSIVLLIMTWHVFFQYLPEDLGLIKLIISEALHVQQESWHFRYSGRFHLGHRAILYLFPAIFNNNQNKQNGRLSQYLFMEKLDDGWKVIQSESWQYCGIRRKLSNSPNI